MYNYVIVIIMDYYMDGIKLTVRCHYDYVAVL